MSEPQIENIGGEDDEEHEFIAALASARKIQALEVSLKATLKTLENKDRHLQIAREALKSAQKAIRYVAGENDANRLGWALIDIQKALEQIGAEHRP